MGLPAAIVGAIFPAAIFGSIGIVGANLPVAIVGAVGTAGSAGDFNGSP
jgi:hypothetical protein